MQQLKKKLVIFAQVEKKTESKTLIVCRMSRVPKENGRELQLKKKNSLGTC